MISDIEGRPVYPAALNRENARARYTRIRNIIDGVRPAVLLIKQLPIQPLLATLVVSLALGAVPVTMTAIYSMARAVADWYHQHLKNVELS